MEIGTEISRKIRVRPRGLAGGQAVARSNRACGPGLWRLLALAWPPLAWRTAASESAAGRGASGTCAGPAEAIPGGAVAVWGEGGGRAPPRPHPASEPRGGRRAALRCGGLGVLESRFSSARLFFPPQSAIKGKLQELGAYVGNPNYFHIILRLNHFHCVYI
uniref:Uncharacterized protein n=1 Tax=Castor canadensis TaxID=51338 RepID=A0A8C0W1B2_CASCN